MSTVKLEISKELWSELMAELRQRGKGYRESGAFLLGPQNGFLITEYFCYDDLDPHSLDQGYISIDGRCFIPLWKHCELKGLRVLADIHTHPSNWTGQSRSDKKNPMIRIKGHISIIAPNYAMHKNQLLSGVGIHIYMGNSEWESFSTTTGVFRIIEKEVIMDENNLNRLATGIMTKYNCSYVVAMEKLNEFSLYLDCGEKIRKSPSLQAALLTTINSGSRAFLGGVYVKLPEDTPCIIPWSEKKTLNEIAFDLGGILSKGPPRDSFKLNFGLEAGVAGNCWEVVCNGWQGGILSNGEHISLDQSDNLTIGGVLAGGIGVGLSFMKVTGIDITAGDTSVGVSLWRPDLNWLDPDAVGPVIEYLPKKFWLLGLGHLGQAYLWNIGFLPFKDQNDVTILLQDFDKMTFGNFSAGLLCYDEQVGRYKTRVSSEWLEKRGFKTIITERKFSEETMRQDEEPYIALCGFDSAKSRSIIENAGFDAILESALGADVATFDRIVLHTFPNSSKSAREIWGSLNDDSPSMNAIVHKYFLQNGHECGILATTLASKAISASFVGAVASSFVIAEALRGLNDGFRYDKIVAQLRSLTTVHAFSHKKYDIEMVRNGFIHKLKERCSMV